MLRGVSFEESCAEKLFPKLDALMNGSTYEWYIDDVELNSYVFHEGRYSSSGFRGALSELTNLSFARIRRYPLGAEIEPVDQYSDFVESDCDVLILFFDGGFYEIYLKDEVLIHRLFQLCTDNGSEEIKYIDDASDGRSRMYF